MAAVRERDNNAELQLRKSLHKSGFRFRLHSRRLLGRPDIVLHRYRSVIFLDGDYWHGRALLEAGDEGLRKVIRGDNYDWWRAKLEKNIARDRQVTRGLQRQGWLVLRIWESDFLRQPQRVLDLVVSRLRRREPG